jgi:hypothetical protein
LFSNLWSWATANSKIEIAFLKCLSIISKDCVTGNIVFFQIFNCMLTSILFLFCIHKVCKCLTLHYEGVPHAILKLLITTMVMETVKAKSPKTNFDILKLGFDVLVNCCACIEGRILIVKVSFNWIFHRNGSGYGFSFTAEYPGRDRSIASGSNKIAESLGYSNRSVAEFLGKIFTVSRRSGCSVSKTPI